MARVTWRSTRRSSSRFVPTPGSGSSRPIGTAPWTSRGSSRRFSGFHRSVPIPDLLIAAVAERHGAVLVHDDADYERIAAVTGQGLLRLGRADAAT